MTNILLSQIQGAALKDQTVVKAFAPQLAAAGKGIARFIGYVEAGQRPTFYQKKEKGKALRVYAFFELLGQKHITEDEEHGTLESNGKKFRTTMFKVQLDVKLNEKAKFRKLFMKMRNGREQVTHMSQMLGEAFIVNITHNTVGEGDKQKVYANLQNAEGEWQVSAPIIEDPLTGEVKVVPVPAPTRPYQLLLWDYPSKEQWDSIFIDGTVMRKQEDGTEEEVSKNWLQLDIMQKATDFEGSPLHDLLDGLGGLTLEGDAVDAENGEVHDDDATDAGEPAPAPEKSEPAAKEPAKVEPKPEPEKPASAPETKPADDKKKAVDDAVAAELRALGIEV